MNLSPKGFDIRGAILAFGLAVCTVGSAGAVALSLSAQTEITTEMLARSTILVGNPPWWAVIIAMSIIGAESVLLVMRFWRYLVRSHRLAAVPDWVQPAFGVLLLLALAYFGFEVFRSHGQITA